jgi:dihydroorotase/N-acyl-D-amino-acid deacylase
MRDYGDRLVEAVDEQLDLARRTGCRLQISHLQAVGPRNWNRQQVALDRIERAREDGVDIAFDCYPYTRGSTVLSQLLPQRALEGGLSELVGRLTDPPARAEIAEETEASLAQGWDGILIASVRTPANQLLVGKTIAAIAEERGAAPVEACLDLLIEERGHVNMLEINQSEDNLRQALAHPLSNVISDGVYVHGRPHPRLHGTFPHLLGDIVRDRKWMSLSEAIRKITSSPARRFGLDRAGTLASGYQADITVFNPRTVGSRATYEVPAVPPEGIEYVLRQGRVVLRKDL